MEDDEDKKIFSEFIATFSRGVDEKGNQVIKEEQKDLAEDTINYILRQMNFASLQGVIYYDDYRALVLNGAKGLFKLVYLQHYSEDIVSRDVIFASSFNLLFLLFTRVFEGKHYQYLLKELDSRRPVNIVGGK